MGTSTKSEPRVEYGTISTEKNNYPSSQTTSTKMTKIGLLLSCIFFAMIVFYSSNRTINRNSNNRMVADVVVEDVRTAVDEVVVEVHEFVEAVEEEEEDVAISFHDSAFFNDNVHPSLATSKNAGGSVLSDVFNPEQMEYFLSSSSSSHESDDNDNKVVHSMITANTNQATAESTTDSSITTCQPRHIHLSLGNQQHPQEKKKTITPTSSAMTISFSLPRVDGNNHDSGHRSENIDSDSDDNIHANIDNHDDEKMNEFCHPKQVLVSILYQKIDDNNSHSHMNTYNEQKKVFLVLDHPNYDTSTTTTSNSGSYTDYSNFFDTTDDQYQTTSSYRREMETHTVSSPSSSIVNQYKVRSPKTNETYISDYIYHVQLDNLDYDSTYTYSIQVEQKQHQQQHKYANSGNKSQSKNKSSYGNTKNHYDNPSHHQYTLTSYDDTAITTVTSSNIDNSITNHNVGRKLRLKQQQRQQQEKNGQEIIIGKTPKFTFKTTPAPLPSSSSSASTTSSPIKPTKFAIVGDLGQTYNSSITMKNILLETAQTKNNTSSTTPASLVLIAGDMSYANSIQPQWDSWFQLIEPIISQTPLMVAAGNHEIECDMDSQLPFIAYETRFRMPNRIQDAIMGKVKESYFASQWGCANPSVFQGTYDYGNAYYSFTYGGIKTIVLSSYSESNADSKQYHWLEHELKYNTDRDITPWIIVMMHTQFYTTFKGHDNEFQTNVMRDSMEHLFYEYGVNLVFSGHDHGYMRSKNMYNWTVDESGPIYIIVGEGGNREGHIKNYLHDDPEEWVDVRDKSVFGFGTLEVVNRTSAHWKWIMDPNDEGASFTDDVWLSNKYYGSRE